MIIKTKQLEGYRVEKEALSQGQAMTPFELI